MVQRGVTVISSRLFADISGYQTNVNLEAYRHAGHKIIAIKSSEGTNFRDPSFSKHWEAAKHEGLHRIAYHFLRPSHDRRGASEAKVFLENVRANGYEPHKDFLCCDFEVLDNVPGYIAVRYFREFQHYLKHNTRGKLITYSYSAFLESLGHFPVDRLWLADYASKLWVPRGFPTAWAWQRTDGINGPKPRSLAGIGKCDVSLLNRATYLRLR